jgi:two-component system, chemotaxis family, chemotaxis protein CheY
MRILIVEDDLICRFMIQRLIESHCDCDVAVNGREAVDAFNLAVRGNRPYDVILLDIMMPEMDGQQVMKEIRQIEEKKGIIYPQGVKIIMTTALDDPKNVVSAFHSLCDSYLVKPIIEETLFKKIREHYPGFGLSH